MSHEHERAFSASLIYLGLGAVAAARHPAVRRRLDRAAARTPKVLEHVAEVALIFALFSSGLKLDRALRWREWGSVVAPARRGDAADHRRRRAVRLAGARPLARRAALLLGAIARAHRPGARRRHRRRAAGRRGGARAELRAHRRGGRQRRARGAVRAARRLHRREGRDRLARRVARWRTCSTPARRAWRSASRSAGPRPGACTCCATASCSRRRSTAITRSPPRSSSTGSPRRPAATASSRCSPAGLAFRRYEHGHELNGRVHRGAEQVEKFMELAAILLLGSLLTGAGLTAPGWEGWLLAVVLLVVIRPLSTLALAGRLAGRDRRRPLVRRLVRRARRRHPLLRRDRGRRGRALAAARRSSWCGPRSRA